MLLMLRKRGYGSLFFLVVAVVLMFITLIVYPGGPTGADGLGEEPEIIIVKHAVLNDSMIVYNISLFNNGTKAYNVSLTDNTTFFDVDPAQNSSDTWLIGDMDANESISIIARRRSIKCDNYDNTAHLMYDGTMNYQKSAYASIIKQCPALTLEKNDSVDPAYNGSFINYTIIIDSPQQIFNATLTEDYDSSIEFISAQPAGVNETTWELGNLTNQTIIITVNITDDANNVITLQFFNSSGAIFAMQINESTELYIPFCNEGNESTTCEITGVKNISNDTINLNNLTGSASIIAQNAVINASFVNLSGEINATELIRITAKDIILNNVSMSGNVSLESNNITFGDSIDADTLITNSTRIICDASVSAQNLTLNSQSLQDTSCTYSVGTQIKRIIEGIGSISFDPLSSHGSALGLVLNMQTNLYALKSGAFNVPALLTFFNTSHRDPTPGYDTTDNASLIQCPQSRCADVQIVPAGYEFFVDHWTTYGVMNGSGEPSFIISVNNTHTVENGSFITFYYNVTNIGTSSGEAEVNITYDSQLAYVSASPAPNVSNNLWYVDTNTSSTINITLFVDITDRCYVKNNALLSFQNSTGTYTTSLDAVSDINCGLSVTKTAVRDGNDIKYTIQILNDGNLTAYEINLTEYYPTDSQFVNSSINLTDNRSFNLSELNSTFSFDIDVILSGIGTHINHINVSYVKAGIPLNVTTSHTTTISDDGGGSGGGSSTECISSWICTEWSECIDGYKTRTCRLDKNCKDNPVKPLERIACYIPYEEEMEKKDDTQKEKPLVERVDGTIEAVVQTSDALSRVKTSKALSVQTAYRKIGTIAGFSKEFRPSTKGVKPSDITEVVYNERDDIWIGKGYEEDSRTLSLMWEVPPQSDDVELMLIKEEDKDYIGSLSVFGFFRAIAEGQKFIAGESFKTYGKSGVLGQKYILGSETAKNAHVARVKIGDKFVQIDLR